MKISSERPFGSKQTYIIWNIQKKGGCFFVCKKKILGVWKSTRRNSLAKKVTNQNKDRFIPKRFEKKKFFAFHFNMLN